MILESGQIFNKRYYLVKQVGVGGFSEVWLAEDNWAANMKIAIKIYARETGLDEFGIKQFQKEYSDLFPLNHPHILKAAHYDIYMGRPYLTLPYCPNGSLKGLIYRMINERAISGRDGLMEESEIRKVISQIADALDYLHGERTIHRDLKPDNILIDNKGNYLLMDFGISSSFRSALSMSKSSNNSSATIAYAAPEVMLGKPEAASDIFSLGVTIFQMCTGNLPWNERGGSILSPDSPLLRLELPRVYSKELQKLMQDCILYDPDKRPKASDLIKRLGEKNPTPYNEQKQVSNPTVLLSRELNQKKSEEYTDAPRFDLPKGVKKGGIGQSRAIKRDDNLKIVRQLSYTHTVLFCLALFLLDTDDYNSEGTIVSMLIIAAFLIIGLSGRRWLFIINLILSPFFITLGVLFIKEIEDKHGAHPIMAGILTFLGGMLLLSGAIIGLLQKKSIIINN